MQLKKVLRYFRRALFLLLLLSILVYVSQVFERKSLDSAWNYTLKVGGFQNEPENSFQIMGFGSSHMYCTMNPLYIYEKTGVRSYVLATQQQPVEATYYYIKEAFETQSPDVVVIEAYMYLLDKTPATEGVAHDAVDPFPTGANKLKMIHVMDTVDGKQNYYFNFLKYHTRWKDLTQSDFDDSYKKQTDPMHGYVFLTESAPNNNAQLDYTNTEEVPLDSVNLEYLRKTIELVQDNGSEVLLLLSPYEMTQENGRAKALHRFAAEENVRILDMNLCYNEMGIDNATDFYDASHFNVNGSEKASLYLTQYLQEYFTLTERNVEDVAQWQADLEEYHSQKAG